MAVQKLASAVGSLTCGALANVVKKTFDETCSNPNKQKQCLMARFEYRDSSVFTVLGSNDAALLDTNSQPMTSGAMKTIRSWSHLSMSAV
jgi:hypothetical protein